MSVSEVTQIRRTIAEEYMAARWGLTGLAQGTAQHRVISRRMERMEAGHQALRALVGETAIALIAETLDTIPDQPTRHHVQQVLQYGLGDTEETEQMLDWINDLWETLDLLQARFGRDGAHRIVHAHPSLEENIRLS